MRGLPQEVIDSCHVVLLRCEQFDSMNSLRAMFVSEELAPYRNHLRDGSSKAERVSLAIDHLVYQFTPDRRPVLPILLSALRPQDKNDALYSDLEAVCRDLELHLGRVETIDVPIVVAAMNQTEATALAEETIFKSDDIAPAERTRFQQFRQALQSLGFNELRSHYGAERESWRPPAFQQGTIGEVIDHIFDRVNHLEDESQKLPTLIPYFLSGDFFGNRTARQLAVKHLRQFGGILIIDAVSLFHPMIRQGISRSEVGSNKRVAVLVVSPVDASIIPVNQVIEQVIDLQLEGVLTRFDYELDHLCEIGLGDLRALSRWLFSVLPETAANVQKQRPSPSTLARLRQMRGVEPRGIYRAFHGQGDAR